MSQHKSVEKALDVVLTNEVVGTLNAIRQAWKLDNKSVPKGLTCSESKEGEFVLVASSAAFVLIPGACVVKGIGAIQLLGSGHAVMDEAQSPNLLVRAAGDGWHVSVKFVPPKPPRPRNIGH